MSEGELPYCPHLLVRLRVVLVWVAGAFSGGINPPNHLLEIQNHDYGPNHQGATPGFNG